MLPALCLLNVCLAVKLKQGRLVKLTYPSDVIPESLDCPGSTFVSDSLILLGEDSACRITCVSGLTRSFLLPESLCDHQIHVDCGDDGFHQMMFACFILIAVRLWRLAQPEAGVASILEVALASGKPALRKRKNGEPFTEEELATMAANPEVSYVFQLDSRT